MNQGQISTFTICAAHANSAPSALNKVGGNHLKTALLLLSLISPFSLTTTEAAPLSAARSGTNVVITWSDPSVLQSSLTVTGLWSDLPLATSPYTTQPTNARSFYRLRLSGSTVIAAPTGLTLYADEALFFLSWNAVSNATSYNIYRAMAPGLTRSNYMSWPGGTRVTGLSNPATAFTNLVNGTRYYFIVTASDAASESAESVEVSEIYGPRAEVHGSVFAEVPIGTNMSQISLPGITLCLSNMTDASLKLTTVSALDGSFIFPAQPAGNYSLCWQAPGYISGCTTQLVAISNQTVYLDPERIDPLTNASVGVVYGRVTFKDGSLVQLHDAFYGIDLNATVSIAPTNGPPVATVTPNEQGDYVIPNVPRQNQMQLTASAEGTSVSTNINTFNVGLADLTLPNTPPVIERLIATVNSTQVWRVPPGTTVQLTATASDAEGDALSYLWLPGSGSLLSSNGASVSWQLPNSEGAHFMYPRVKDGHGGYATERFHISTILSALFNGRVTGSDFSVVPVTNGMTITYQTNYPALSNALVRINDASTLTDSNGIFSMQLTNLADSYLLTITEPGYTPLSRVYAEETYGQDYRLYAAQKILSTATNGGFSIVDSNGTQVVITNGSLVYTNGSSFIGSTLCAYVTTLDPCDQSVIMPPNPIAVENGTNYFLSAMGVANIDLTDTNGAPLNLRAGATAFVRTLVSANCYSTVMDLSPSNGVWRHDFSTGTWQPTAQAVLDTSVPAPPAYEANVPVLGFLQHADTKKSETTTILLKADRTLNYPFVVTITAVRTNPVGTTAFPPKTFFNEGDKNNSTDVPTDTQIDIGVINLKVQPGDTYADPTNTLPTYPFFSDVILRYSTNSGAKNRTNTVPLGLLSKNPNKIPAKNETSVTTNGNSHFLTVKKFTGGSNELGNAYYQAIGAMDSNNTPTITFTNWRIRNGFLNANGTTNTGVVTAFYFNAADLGFGRLMRMKTNATGVAYYVSNYETADKAAADPNLKENPITVAMEFGPHPNTIYSNLDSFTRFYVFQGDTLTNAADLDKAELKYVPNLCMVCHGGDVLQLTNFAANKGKIEAKFIPFDLESYTYAIFPRGLGPVGQKDAFKELNRGVLKTTPTAAVRQLVEGWYGGATLPQDFKKDYYPDPGWKTQTNIYRDVVKVSCRICHSTRDGDLNFATYDKFAGKLGTGRIVCDSLKMPNAQRTFSIFWGSASANKPGVNSKPPPNQPEMLGTNLNWRACPVPP